MSTSGIEARRKAVVRGGHPPFEGHLEGVAPADILHEGHHGERSGLLDHGPHRFGALRVGHARLVTREAVEAAHELTLGHTVREAFNLMYNFESACRIQVDALAAGRERLTLIPQSVIERTRKQLTRPRKESEYRDWPALLRMLDRQGVEFRN